MGTTGGTVVVVGAVDGQLEEVLLSLRVEMQILLVDGPGLVTNRAPKPQLRQLEAMSQGRMRRVDIDEMASRQEPVNAVFLVGLGDDELDVERISATLLQWTILLRSLGGGKLGG